MAEEKFSSSNKKFYNLIGSNWTRKVPEGTDGAVSRVNKNGDTVHELLFRSISGCITDATASYNERVKAEEIKITLEDAGETISATLSLKSGYGDDFVKKLPNIKKGDFYKLAPYEMDSDKKNDKGEFYKNKGITCYDINNVKTPRYYTAATPHDFPQLPKNATAKDKTLYNDFDKIDFLKEIVKKWNETTTSASFNTNDAPASYTKLKPSKQEVQMPPTEAEDLPF